MTAGSHMEPQTHGERRRHRRGPVRCKAVIRVAGRALSCDVENLSRTGGLFLVAAVCRIPVEVGSRVIVELAFLEASPIAGVVVRRDRSGGQFAIAFEGLGAALVEQLGKEISRAIEADECPRIVVVDPLPAERGRVAAAVRRAGGEPVEASTPLEAIDKIQRPENRVAAAAIRDSLTQTDGGELAEYLADQHPSMPVAILAEGTDAGATTRAGSRDVPLVSVDGDLSGPVRELVESTKAGKST